MSIVDRRLAAPEPVPSRFWVCARREHERRVDDLLAGHLARAARGIRHPVEDFLFDYYSYRPARLRRWHPGVGTALLLDGDPQEVPTWRDRRIVELAAGPVAVLDTRAFLTRRGEAVRQVRDLLRATASRPPNLGCFGLHEWAMVYRGAGDRRHLGLPLRLGARGTDEVLEQHRLRCSHFDATRFFTPDALPRNEIQPSRARQAELEQPGCLHSAMDLYKWAYKLAPATPAELIADCYELARDVREVDMRASPYDLTELGHAPVCIETPSGRAEYVTAQRGFAERAAPLRATLLAICEQLLADQSSPSAAARPAPTRR